MAPVAAEDVQALRKQLEDTQARNKELEQHVADLSDDITRLCEARGSSMWSSSYILTERYNTLQSEVRALRGRTAAMTTERDALRAEAARLREGAGRAAVERAALDARVETLQGELAFFQTSASTALHERDEAVFQGDELRRQLADAEERLKGQGAQLQAEQLQRRAAAAQLDATKSELHHTQQQLQQALQAAAQLPEVRRQLDKARAGLAELSEEHKRLQAFHEVQSQQLDEATSDLSEAKRTALQLRKELAEAGVQAQAAQQLEAQLRAEVANVQKQLDDAHAEAADARSVAQGAALALAAAQAVLLKTQGTTDLDKVLEQAGAKAQAEAAATAAAAAAAATAAAAALPTAGLPSEREAALEAQLQATAADKAAALTRVSELQSALDDSSAQAAALEHRCHDLKVRLASATQEKVEALLKVASITSDTGSRRIGSVSAGSPALSTPPGSFLGGLELRALSEDTTEATTGVDSEALVSQLQEQLGNLERLLRRVHRLRCALQTLAPRLLQPGGGGGARKGELAELSRLGDEVSRLRAHLGLDSAASEQEDLVLLQQPESGSRSPPKPSAAAPAGARRAPTGGGEAQHASPTLSSEAAGLLAAPHPGRLDRALSREVVELTVFAIETLKSANKVVALSALF